MYWAVPVTSELKYWRDAMFSGQDGISLSSIWEQHQKGIWGITMLFTLTDRIGHSISDMLCMDEHNCSKTGFVVTKGIRRWMWIAAHTSRCVSLAQRLFGVAALPVAPFKCSWNTRVQSRVTLAWASMTCISGAIYGMLSFQRTGLSH